MKTIFPAVEFDTSRPRLPLDGVWAFSYDPGDAGVAEGWFAEGKTLPEEVVVPGCAQVRRYDSAQGNERVTEVDIPEHSQTIMLKHGCMHPAWYQRTFTIPAEWQGQQIHLHVGGVKPAAEFWLNGQKLGETLTSRSPVRVNLTPHVKFGAQNMLTVRIHWPRFRLDGVYDVWHAWSGIYRGIRVEAVPPVSLADIHVTPSIKPPAAAIALTLHGEEKTHLRVTCEIAGQDGDGPYRQEMAVNGMTAELHIPMPGAKLWSPDHPNLYQAVVRVYEGDKLLDEGSLRFGLREIAYNGFQVLLNGTPIFLRGGCDDQIYPETVCPPADTAFFRERIRKAKAYGFNYTKSACEVFSREFLDAADELGYLVCQEMPFGVLGELRALRNDPPDALLDLWQRELANIVTDTRNHPSVVLYSMASEMDIDVGLLSQFTAFSRVLPAITRRLNPQALLFDVTAGFCFDTQTRHGERDTDLLEDCIENAYSLTPLTGPLPIPETVHRPFFLHEWNWITGMPDPELLKRYASLPLAPVQIPEMVEAAGENGLLEALPGMVEQSRKLKYVLRKDAIEQAFAHPKVAGYHGWLIHDVSYCPEGVFNEFWEEPADLPAEEFRTYNNDTVLTLEDGEQRSFTYGQRVPMGVTIVHFGEAPVDRPALRWRLVLPGKVLAEGSRQLKRIACGRRVTVPSLGIPHIDGQAPAKAELICELWDGDARKVCWNHWPLWLFPALNDITFPQAISTSLSLPQGFRAVHRPYDPLVAKAGTRVFVAHRLRDGKGEPLDGVLQFLAAGGRVFALSNGDFPETYSAFYRTVPYVLGREGNMGTVVRAHAALGDFPHEGWCDLPFVPFIQGACPMRLDVFRPQRIDPVIRSIPHPVTMTDKAYLFEVGIGSGTLLLCSLNLQSFWHVDPAARHLLYSMLSYLAGETCAPETTLSPEQFREILTG